MTITGSPDDLQPTSIQPTAVRLVRMEKEAVACFNQIFSKAGQVTINHDQEAFACSFLPDFLTYTPHIGLKIQAGVHFIWLGVEHLEFFELHAGDHVTHLPLEIRSAFFEAVFEPLLNWFESRSGTPCAVRQIQFEPDGIENYGHALSFRAVRKRDGLRLNGSLSLDRLGLKWLAGLFEPLPSRPPALDPSAIPIRATLEIGRTWISLGDLAQLERYDVVIIEDCIDSTDTKKIGLRFSDHYYLEGEVGEQQLTIQTIRREIMSDEAEAPQKEAGHEDTTACLDEVGVELRFELGTKTISVGELKQVQPGYTLDLEKTLDRPVAIKANGKLIGRGELVQIENYLGVRFLEINP